MIMFKLDDSLEKLEMPSARVLKMFRSMRDVQLALPGQQSQEASAYLCQFRTDKGVATVAAFHLQNSGKLAFYRSDPREVNVQNASSMLEKGLDFVESMGFLLTDMDIDQMEESDREMLWTSLPLYKGPGRSASGGSSSLKPEKTRLDAEKPPEIKPVDEAATEEAGTAASQAPTVVDPDEAPVPSDSMPSGDDDGAVDELIAAVESLRTGRSQLNRSVRKQPSAKEFRQRSQQLKENLGRILVSL